MINSIKKICVCSVQMPFVWGGAEIFRENLVNQLIQRSYQVETVILPLQVHPFEEVVKGCLTWRLVNLNETLDCEPIDLVIGTKFPSYMVPHPKKIIWLQHQHRDIYDLYGTIYSGLDSSSKDVQLRNKIMEMDQMAFGEARKIFSQSKTVAGRLKRYSDFESTVVYPPLADADQFHFTALDDFVLSVSRLAGNKRVHLLIQALQYVSSRFKAVIVGEGNLRDHYERIAEEVGVTNRILFTGKISRSEVIDYYSRAGVLFYCPFDEDYGYAQLEAFYSRKPVITTHDSGGVAEFVDSSTGWVTAPEPEAIAECIETALTQKNEARARGTAGFERISYINWDYVIDHLLG